MKSRPIIIRTKGHTMATSMCGPFTLTTFGNRRYYILIGNKIVRAGWYATADEATAELKPKKSERLLLEVGGRNSDLHGRTL